jgi:hypothetical protein
MPKPSLKVAVNESSATKALAGGAPGHGGRTAYEWLRQWRIRAASYLISRWLAQASAHSPAQPTV